MPVLRPQTDDAARDRLAHEGEVGEWRADADLGARVTGKALTQLLCESLGLDAGTMHLPVADDEGTPRHGAASRAATPGSTRPSTSSRLAPPPVERWLTALVRPAFSNAAPESPPPTTVTAPADVASASARAVSMVP